MNEQNSMVLFPMQTIKKLDINTKIQSEKLDISVADVETGW